MARTSPPRVERDDVVRLWFQRQGLTDPRGTKSLTRRRLVDHLERTGALQLDPIHVVDRAHYLTLWSRFGKYERKRLDRWAYADGAAYEYWGHEASLLPTSHLPLGRRRMRRFPGRWAEKSWWSRVETSQASRRRVLRRLRAEGPLESADFERRPGEKGGSGWGEAQPYKKEDKRSLGLLWQAGRVGVRERRQFRRVWDLADRVYGECETATPAGFEDSWLLIGLSGNGVASERHLVNYFTDTELSAAERKRVIARNRKKGAVVEVEVPGVKGPCYALPEHLEELGRLPEPEGTNLLCPFDSFLWQRGRAEELLDFKYRIEIYVPAAKRRYGYYVLPILHDGRLVGRVDPKLHRDRGVLEIRKLQLEAGFDAGKRFLAGLRDTFDELCEFLGAEDRSLPRGWGRKLG